MKVYILLEGSWDWSDYFIQYLGGEDIKHIFSSIETASEYVSKTYDDTYNKDLKDLSNGKTVTLKEWGKRGDSRYSYLYIKEYECY